MTANQVARLCFKILAIYFVMQLFYQPDNIAKYLLYRNAMQEHVRAKFVAAILPSILFFLSGIVLWFTTPHFANSVFKPKPDQEMIQASLEDFQAVAFSVAGLFLFATSFSQIVEYVVYYGTFPSHSEGKSEFLHLIIIAALKVALSVWLILGSKGIVNGIRFLRRPRIPEQE